MASIRPNGATFAMLKKTKSRLRSDFASSKTFHSTFSPLFYFCDLTSYSCLSRLNGSKNPPYVHKQAHFQFYFCIQSLTKSPVFSVFVSIVTCKILQLWLTTSSRRPRTITAPDVSSSCAHRLGKIQVYNDSRFFGQNPNFENRFPSAGICSRPREHFFSLGTKKIFGNHLFFLGNNFFFSEHFLFFGTIFVFRNNFVFFGTIGSRLDTTP